MSKVQSVSVTALVVRVLAHQAIKPVSYGRLQPITPSKADATPTAPAIQTTTAILLAAQA